MKGFELVESEQLSLSPFLGYEHPFFIINTHTVFYTLVMLAVLAIMLIPIQWIVKKNNGVARFLTLSFVQFLIDLVNQAIAPFSFAHFCFISSLFCFILTANILSIIPGLEEPTTDLNTTFALGLISFVYVQAAAIKTHGLWAYIKDYFAPFFIMLPLNIVGKLSTVISISFRLFGNIFGGSIITGIYSSAIKGSIIFETLGLLSGLNIIIVLFFTIFEGFLQAFVFAMLSLTYLSIALQTDGH